MSNSSVLSVYSDNPSRIAAWVKQNRFALLSVMLVTMFSLLIFLPIVTFVTGEDVDYGFHLEFIVQVLNGQPISEFVSRVPHFWYHLNVALLYKLVSDLSVEGATILVTLFYYVLGSLAVLMALIVLSKPPKSLMGSFVYSGIALAASLFMPVNVLTPTNLYMGYIPANVYHNPTIIVLKPFAIAFFLFAAAAFNPKPAVNLSTPVIAVVGIIGILAKPSFALAFLPVLVIAAYFYHWRHLPVRWPQLMLGILFPTGAVLALQFVLFGGTGIIFAPLGMLNEWEYRINPLTTYALGLKFFLSILFPLCVYMLNLKKAVRNPYLNLAWLTFFIGAAFMYLLAEGGERLRHGNFAWSAQVSLFVLFVISAGFFIEQSQKLLFERRILSRQVIVFVVCGLALWLHLICGLQWYQIHVNAHWMGDIIANVW